MKEIEDQCEENQPESNLIIYETTQRNCEKDCENDANYNEIVEEIVECLSEVNEANCNSVAADHNDIIDEGLSQYGGMQSAVDIPSEINCIYNIDHQYENDSYPSFPEFNCISLQEDERTLFKHGEKEKPTIHFDNYR